MAHERFLMNTIIKLIARACMMLLFLLFLFLFICPFRSVDRKWKALVTIFI